MKTDVNNFSKPVLFSLKVYADLLIKWQDKINLVSKNSMKDLWTRHIQYSAQLYKLLP